MTCVMQAIVGNFTPASRLPDKIISAPNAYKLVRPDRFGLSISRFCSGLEEIIRKHYSDEELLKLYNLEDHNGDDPIAGLSVSVTLDASGLPRSNRAQRTAPDYMAAKYPEAVTKLLLLVFEDVSGLPGAEICRDILTIPMQAILTSAPDITGGYMVYAHTFTHKEAAFGLRGEKEPSYVGITKNGWAHRWGQHLASAASGSPYRFHEGIRRFRPTNAVFHEVLTCGASEDDAMRIEEWAVDAFSLYPKGFNMVPGGRAGLRYVAAKGGPRSIDWERREGAIRNLPNPLISARWRDDDYAASIICSNPNNFDQHEIHRIRFMADVGKRPEDIAAELQCSISRVRNLLRGETYARIH